MLDYAQVKFESYYAQNYAGIMCQAYHEYSTMWPQNPQGYKPTHSIYGAQAEYSEVVLVQFVIIVMFQFLGDLADLGLTYAWVFVFVHVGVGIMY